MKLDISNYIWKAMIRPQEVNIRIFRRYSGLPASTGTTSYKPFCEETRPVPRQAAFGEDRYRADLGKAAHLGSRVDLETLLQNQWTPGLGEKKEECRKLGLSLLVVSTLGPLIWLAQTFARFKAHPSYQGLLGQLGVNCDSFWVCHFRWGTQTTRDPEGAKLTSSLQYGTPVRICC